MVKQQIHTASILWKVFSHYCGSIYNVFSKCLQYILIYPCLLATSTNAGTIVWHCLHTKSKLAKVFSILKSLLSKSSKHFHKFQYSTEISVNINLNIFWHNLELKTDYLKLLLFVFVKKYEVLGRMCFFSLPQIIWMLRDYCADSTIVQML